MSDSTIWYDELIAEISRNSEAILSDYRRFYETSLMLLAHNTAHQSNADQTFATGAVSRLRFFKSENCQAAPILLIPSVINKSDILDINRANSLCLFLKRQADVYLISWDNLSCDAKLETYIEDIKRFIQKIYQLYNRKIHLIGYCLGGNLACASYFQAPDMIEKIVLIATPWDFSKLSYNVTLPLSMTKDYIPAGLLTFYLNNINLDKIIEKYSKFASKSLNEEQAELFIKVESWANNGINLPISVAKTIYYDFFSQNSIMNRNWQIGGSLIDPGKIEVPVLIVSTDNDKIVTKGSAEAIIKFLPHYQLISTSYGHVGVIISSHSQEFLRPQLAKFLLSKEES